MGLPLTFGLLHMAGVMKQLNKLQMGEWLVEHMSSSRTRPRAATSPTGVNASLCLASTLPRATVHVAAC